MRAQTFRNATAAIARNPRGPRSHPGGSSMNLNLSGRHLDITPAIRRYVQEKLGRVTRHFDHVIDLNVILSVDKLQQKVEASAHVAGRDIHVEAIDADMYAAIDALADKLDRQI